ncbi:MAG: hypothetical protein F6K41_40470 [Symploca sp. SIO3E6]|nr:hypothetical protein [Caldora sp. SIO3E6]
MKRAGGAEAANLDLPFGKYGILQVEESSPDAFGNGIEGVVVHKRQDYSGKLVSAFFCKIRNYR